MDGIEYIMLVGLLGFFGFIGYVGFVSAKRNRSAPPPDDSTPRDSSPTSFNPLGDDHSDGAGFDAGSSFDGGGGHGGF